MSNKIESIFTRRPLPEIYKEIQTVYKNDNRPWVIGFSGGKDSTATLQLIWSALSQLPKTEVSKPVYIISSNTLVESPILLRYVKKIHKLINQVAKRDKLPFEAIHLKPEVNNTFWVNLIGRGYPAPTRSFRWCTDRLKIKTADKFIIEKVSKFGEVILVLGVRKSESATRAQSMSLHKLKGTLLSRHTKFPQAFVYTPVEEFSTDDVWTYLLQKKSPWDANNRELLSMYSRDDTGECPLVIDKTTPSCGGSRFGCWVCTVVQKDNSMINQIENGETWLKPLLEIRDSLHETTDPEKKFKYRDFRGRDGSVRYIDGDKTKISRGPYKLEFRKDLLRKLLQTQEKINDDPKSQGFQLIIPEELHEIRKIWKVEHGDWEDSVPKIYREVTGNELDWSQDDLCSHNEDESKLLEEICEKHKLPTELVIKLINVEKELQGMTRRSSLYSKLDSALKREWREEQEVLTALNSKNKKRDY